MHLRFSRAWHQFFSDLPYETQLFLKLPPQKISGGFATLKYINRVYFTGCSSNHFPGCRLNGRMSQSIVDKIGFFIICSLYFQQENKEIQVTPKYYAPICTHEPLQYSERSEENFNGLQMVTLLFRVAVLFIHEYVFIFMHFTSATCLTYCHKDIMHFFLTCS